MAADLTYNIGNTKVGIKDVIYSHLLVFHAILAHEYGARTSIEIITDVLVRFHRKATNYNSITDFLLKFSYRIIHEVKKMGFPGINVWDFSRIFESCLNLKLSLLIHQKDSFHSSLVNNSRQNILKYNDSSTLFYFELAMIFYEQTGDYELLYLENELFKAIQSKICTL